MNANGEDIDWTPDPNDPDDYTEAAAKQMIEESTAPAESLRRRLTQALVEAGFAGCIPLLAIRTGAEQVPGSNSIQYELNLVY